MQPASPDDPRSWQSLQRAVAELSTGRSRRRRRAARPQAASGGPRARAGEDPRVRAAHVHRLARRRAAARLGPSARRSLRASTSAAARLAERGVRGRRRRWRDRATWRRASGCCSGACGPPPRTAVPATRAGLDSELVAARGLRTVSDPYTGVRLSGVPALAPDLAMIHAGEPIRRATCRCPGPPSTSPTSTC